MATNAYKRFALVTSIVFLIGLVQSANNWALLRYWKMAGNNSFVDLRSVLQATDCYKKEGFSVYSYEIGNPCAYNYGSLLIRILDFLHIGSNSTEVLGIVLIAFVSIVIGSTELFSNKKSFFSYVFIGLLVLSPPILLLMERGNLDALILFLMATTVFFTSKQRYLISTALILLMTLIKFYPIVLFFDLVFRIKSLKYRIILMCVVLLAAIQVLYDQSRGPGFINIFWASFGAPVWGIYLGYLSLAIPYQLSLVLGVLLFFIAIGSLRQLSSKLSKNEFCIFVFKNQKVELYFIYSTLIHLICFLVGMNFDYRLVFLLLSNLFLVYSTDLARRIRVVIGFCLLSSLWLSYNLHELQPVGDLLILILSAFDALILLRIFSKKSSGIITAKLF